MNKQKLLKDLFRAYYGARKNKRKTISQLKFEMNYESKLLKLGNELYNGTYKIGKSICFISFKPLKREIFAADFRDRIVHHLIYNYINKIFENSFIYDSYSCRVGKGTLCGIKRAEHFVRSCSKNYTQECYVLKLDIKGYFMSINKHILYRHIRGKIVTHKTKHEFDIEWLLDLIRKIIFHDPKTNCFVKGKKSNWDGLPKTKSLFYAQPDTGLPIGNLTSQLFGNIYLDNFDHFVKNTLGCKYYGRYVDDIIIIHRDKEYLKSTIFQIDTYLKEKLLLTVHPKKIFLQTYCKGFSFLGAYIKPYRIYIRKNTKNNFYKTIHTYNFLSTDSQDEFVNSHQSKCIASINSYLGLLSHFNTFKLRNKMVFKHLKRSIKKTILIDCNLRKVKGV